MRCLIELSGECLDLATAEALSVCSIADKAVRSESDGRALLVTGNIDPKILVSRLGLAWSVSQHLFSCKPGEIDSRLDEIALPGNTFRVRTSRLGSRHSPNDGVGLAKHAGEILSARYRVDLENPDSELRILMANEIHAGILTGEIDRSSFEARKPENRPFNHPISLHPKLARALVNLTRAGDGQILLDPFCGTGGVLLEAGLIGCQTLGGDIDERMVEGAAKNLRHFSIRPIEIRKADISEWSENQGRVDAIATDPPYGRSATTAKEPIGALYARAFSACHDALREGGRLAIALPAEKHVGLAKDFRLEGMYPVRVHRSLTRYFCVFSK